MNNSTRTCRIMQIEEFRRLVNSLYEDHVFIDVSLEGMYIGFSGEELPIEDLHEKLAEALNVDEVTSIHVDDFEPPLVWIVYRNRDAERTNFQILKSIEEFYPEKYGVLSESEEAYLQEALSIAGRDIISLRNLRDFAVMFYALQDDAAEVSPERIMDKMSAVCAVIDDRLLALGAEV